MIVPTQAVEQRAVRLAMVCDNMQSLMSAPDDGKFTNDGEVLFRQFRNACLHLRKECDVLDTVTEKQVALNFLCRISKERPFLHKRCSEVLKILLASDAWKDAFSRVGDSWKMTLLRDIDFDGNDLTSKMAEDLRSRSNQAEAFQSETQAETVGFAEEAQCNVENSHDRTTTVRHVTFEDPEDALLAGHPSISCASGCEGRVPEISDENEPYSQPPVSCSANVPAGKSITVVVQRCVSAEITSAEESRTPKRKASIGSGLLVSVSIAEDATEESLAEAARGIMLSKLSGSTSKAESVASLCKRGKTQGIMVIPQLSLASATPEQHKKIADMYDLFVSTIQSSAPEIISKAELERKRSGWSRFFMCRSGNEATLPDIVAGKFGTSPCMEVKSAGPSMQSFSF
jgi:hypothetical protein